MSPVSGFRAAFLAAITGLAVQMVTAAEKEPWKQEFEQICIQVESAADLSRIELLELVNQSEQLLERLSEVKKPQARIYTMRLKRCRDFFSSMAASGQQENPQTDAGL